MGEEMNRKRYYRENEFVWIKELKIEGKVINLNKDTLEMTVEYIDKNGTQQLTEKLWKFDKLKYAKKDELVKEIRRTKGITQVYFAKTKEAGIIPSKREEDAGFDVYACFKEHQLTIEPNDTRMIPTGISSMCSPKFAFILKERGSTGSIGLGQRCGVIDSGYRNEWFVPITNHTTKTIIISKAYDKKVEEDDVIFYPYTKAIAQTLIIPVPRVNVNEITYEELLNFKSERGTGSLGSSDK